MRKKSYKVMALLISIMVVFSCRIVAVAENLETIGEVSFAYIPLDVGNDDGEDMELVECLAQHGQEVLDNWKYRSSTVSIIGIVRLQQSDPRWNDFEMGRYVDDNGNVKIYTIGNSGCTLTCFTMVKNFLDKTSLTPVDVYNYLGAYISFSFHWEEAARKCGYTIQLKLHKDSGISNDTARLAVIGAIDEYSRPAIIGFSYDGNLNNTHFVLGYGYTSDGDIMIYDPASTNNTMLSQYVNETSGAYIHRIYIYNK